MTQQLGGPSELYETVSKQQCHHQRKAPESLKTMLFALASAGGEQVKEYKDEEGDVSGKQATETRGAQV